MDCNFRIERLGDDDFGITVSYINEYEVVEEEVNFMCSGCFLGDMLGSVGMRNKEVYEVLKNFNLN